ncbi:hypothetical protein L4C34_05970 [Vibrio profundum]|uniref:hypothetical protein n=1 Tax=Vibrio profundum TaxID=2910247 RepID=UPI003D0AF244
MRRILESILLIMTIGGGFSGASIVLLVFRRGGLSSWEPYLVLVISFLLYVYILVAGLIFARNKANTKRLKRALLVQVPWLSTPFLYYQFSAGANLATRVYESGVNSFGYFGSEFQIALHPNDPWAIGVNFVALALYVLTLMASRRSWV